jgi:hypothetical protein
VKNAAQVFEEALDKQASTRQASTGHDILNTLLGSDGRGMPDSFTDLYFRLEKEDEQSGELFKAIYDQLSKELTISQGANEALGRLMDLVERGQRWDIGLIRNNVFKAAHSLGLKLPSASF